MELESSPKKPTNDSDDEGQNYREEIQFTFKPERNVPLSLLSISSLKSNTIFIATAGHASAYLLAKVPENTPCIGYIYNEDVKLAEIYSTEDNVATFVVFEITIPATVYYEFSRFFFEKFNAPKVVVLDSCHPNALPVFPKDTVEFPILRSVVSRKAKGSQECCKALEDACPVRGLGGDVLSYCEIHDIAGELYLLLPSDYDIIVSDILLFESLVSKYKELSKPVDKKVIGPIVTRVSSRNVSKSLYI